MMAPNRPAILRLSLSVVLMILCSACGVCPPPERPTGPDTTAHWAGDCEGGVWIDCSTLVEEPYTGFHCSIHDHPAGALVAAGPFVLAEAIRSPGGEMKYRPQAAAFAEPPSQYVGYAGTNIALPDGRFLVPHGTIDYPTGDGHGRRIEYRVGEARFEENY